MPLNDCDLSCPVDQFGLSRESFQVLALRLLQNIYWNTGGGSETVTPFSGGSTADVTDTAVHQIGALGAPGVALQYHVSSIVVSNLAASTATRVDILGGSTVIWSGPAAAAGGGYVISFPHGLELLAGLNQPLNVQDGTTGAAVRANVAGFIGA